MPTPISECNVLFAIKDNIGAVQHLATGDGDEPFTAEMEFMLPHLPALMDIVDTMIAQRKCTDFHDYPPK